LIPVKAGRALEATKSIYYFANLVVELESAKAVGYWKLKVGLALHFSDQSFSFSVNEKGINSLREWLILSIYLPQSTTIKLKQQGIH